MDVYGQCVKISICSDDHANITDTMAARPATATATAGKGVIFLFICK